MKVLVTGGGGFLGRHIVERLLLRGYRVRILGRSAQPDLLARGVEGHFCDLGDKESVVKACHGMDAVFHVAAKAGISAHWNRYYESNVVGTLNILEGCRQAGISRLIYTSTPSVVFNRMAIRGGDESLPYGDSDLSHYAKSKAMAEAAVLQANSSDFKVVALRPHLIFGPGDPHLLPRVIDRVRAGRLCIIGDGTNTVDLTYVGNAAEAHLNALDALQTPGVSGRAYFISQGEPVALWPWINTLLEGLGYPPLTRRLPLSVANCFAVICETLWKWLRRSDDPPMTRFAAEQLAKDHYFDISAAERDLGYCPNTSMQEAVEKTLADLKQRGF